jgi:AP-2 complex subunit beta-1
MIPITVSGPGPIEPQQSEKPLAPQVALTNKETPPIPAEPSSNGLLGENGGDDDNVAPNSAATDSNDPYSNLDGAFGSYLADGPQPQGSGRSDLDDLLL